MAQAMLRQLNTDDLNISVALIQSLIPYGLKAVEEKLQADVEVLAGIRYKHGKEREHTLGKSAGKCIFKRSKDSDYGPQSQE